MSSQDRFASRSLSRRTFVRLVGAAGAGSLLSPLLTRAGRNADAPQEQLVTFPEKTDLILRTDRAPQLETPLHYFRKDLTPNEAFYVRWHLEGIPTSIDPDAFRLQIRGHVEKPASLSIHDLRTQFEPFSIIAVNQCSGNSRSFFEPRVPGGQWKNGAMGNARWTGVRLRDVLNRSVVSAGAVEVSFEGLDRAPLSATPRFAKALGIDHACDGEVMIAYEMNGADLPILNGFPVRLVVPGWYATYWVKGMHEITVLSEKFHGFWMDKAYRIPNTPNGNEEPDHPATETVAINRLSLRSLFVRPEPGERLRRGTRFELEGLAFDSGYGIQRVEVSVDAGSKWQVAQLDPELGKYSWCRWRLPWLPATSGKYRLMVRAFNRAGQQQTTHLWNRSGFMRNVIEQIEVEVT